MEFIKKIEQYIEKDKLLNINKKYLVTLSGGADSTALLIIMHDLGYNIEAVHCNFKLRGEESERDEQFCKSLCSKYKINLHITHFDTRSYAELHKQSIELAARHLRYKYFEQLKKDINAEAILVAHHKDDNVETILMNMLRGTGLHGLTGIHARRDDIIRPLLCVRRSEIEEYLKFINQDFVTDSTNLVDDVTRNKIRLNVIPELLKVNENAIENILSTAKHLSQAEEYIETTIKDKCDSIKLENNTENISTENITEYGLYLRIKKYGFNYKIIEEIYNNINCGIGKIYHSGLYELLIDRNSIIIQTESEPFKEMKIPEQGTYIINSTVNKAIEQRIIISFSDITEKFSIPRKSNKIALDADKVKFPLILRPAKDGDRFHPFGMRGTKLVSDFLTDLKYNLFKKRALLVLEDKRGEIIWIVNERPSENCRITEDSKRAILIELK
ncbi:tRNA lysidine(34) synthetase TilS [Xylanibacter oryzae]|uniref:tRNA lysidine(34) synthetase TilS n=1 Tax=Xylanibacter oryzae TaxID=185293 RepID=UPI0004B2E906|nr:tRNA lysidine(34) synthetase TilS [Xylanibacter oryzae]